MGDVGTSVRGRLVELAGELVGSRIYPKQAPQNAALPYVVYQLISRVPSNSANGPTGTFNDRLQVDCIAASDAAVKALAALTRGLGGWSDAEGDPSVSMVLMLDEHDDFDSPGDGSESGVHRVVQEFSIWYS